MRPRISIRGCVHPSVRPSRICKLILVWRLDVPTHLYKRLCPLVGRSVCRSVCLSVTLSLKLWKTAKFTENRCSLRERTTNQGSWSINESRTQSITHSNHSYMSQGASLAYVGLVSKISLEKVKKYSRDWNFSSLEPNLVSQQTRYKRTTLTKKLKRNCRDFPNTSLEWESR